MQAAVAWKFTIPCSLFFGACTCPEGWIRHLPGSTVIVGLVRVLASAFMLHQWRGADALRPAAGIDYGTVMSLGSPVAEVVLPLRLVFGVFDFVFVDPIRLLQSWPLCHTM